MKKLFTLFTLFVTAVCMNAYDVVVDDMCYTLNKEKKTAIFEQDPSYVYQYLGDIVIPEKIEVDGVEYTVTEIGEYAFFYTKGITSLVMPETIEKIGTYAFCYSIIEKLNIPSKVKVLEPYVFSDCNDLKEITLPEGLEKISEGAFYACKLLKNITIPSTVTTIEGKYTFNLCTSLEELHVNIVTPVAIEEEIMFDTNIYEYTTLFVPEGCKDTYMGTDIWNKFVNIKEEKVATGINNATVEEIENNAMYDLQGRRIYAPIKGIYIQNGKKIIGK